MLTERPELSIWSLLFVALGEGLAIYGLIVAILLSGSPFDGGSRFLFFKIHPISH